MACNDWLRPSTTSNANADRSEDVRVAGRPASFFGAGTELAAGATDTSELSRHMQVEIRWTVAHGSRNVLEATPSMAIPIAESLRWISPHRS
jgi:hypothetical protein